MKNDVWWLWINEEIDLYYVTSSDLLIIIITYPQPLTWDTLYIFHKEVIENINHIFLGCFVTVEFHTFINKNRTFAR